MKTILAPLDFSDMTTRVVAEAVKLARALGGKIVLVHIVQPEVGLVDYAIVSFSVARVNDDLVKTAIDRLEAIKKSIDRTGPEVDTLQAVGSPVAEIVEQASKLSADYIVIGSHGHGAVYDLLVGSTTRGVLKSAPCPVVIVTAPEARQKGAPAGDSAEGEHSSRFSETT